MLQREEVLPTPCYGSPYCLVVACNNYAYYGPRSHLGLRAWCSVAAVVLIRAGVVH